MTLFGIEVTISHMKMVVFGPVKLLEHLGVFQSMSLAVVSCSSAQRGATKANSVNVHGDHHNISVRTIWGEIAPHHCFKVFRWT